MEITQIEEEKVKRCKILFTEYKVTKMGDTRRQSVYVYFFLPGHLHWLVA